MMRTNLYLNRSCPNNWGIYRPYNVAKLKQYVENRLGEITNGKQKPTSRQETMEVDWKLK